MQREKKVLSKCDSRCDQTFDSGGKSLKHYARIGSRLFGFYSTVYFSSILLG